MHCPPLFDFAVNQDPRVVVQCSAAVIRFCTHRTLGKPLKMI
jgi:hypothetical protein